MAKSQGEINSTDSSDNITNLASIDWWEDTNDDDAMFNTFISLDGKDSFWSGSFIPPPPRPIFLEDSATTDGLTTCDLCTWAWKSKSYIVDSAKDSSGEFSWVLTLIIVSVISATVGAVVMITVLHCRSKMKNAEPNDNMQSPSESRCTLRNTILQSSDARHKSMSREEYNTNAVRNVWSWLTSRQTNAPKQLNSPTLPVENHYTHMNEAYGGNDDVLYAELDSNIDYNTHARKNSAYIDNDASTSSAPSSAYYSDLSVSAMPDRTYEVIGGNNQYWDGQYQENENKHKQVLHRLTAISETCPMPSDYV